jgi:hypothetical protein
MKIKQTGTLSIEVYMQIGQEKPVLITDNMGIEIIPLDLDIHFEKSLPI